MRIMTLEKSLVSKITEPGNKIGSSEILDYVIDRKSVV